MLYKKILFLSFFLFLTNCTTENLFKNKPNIHKFNSYSNKGFALIYNDDLYKNEILNKKIDDRSLTVFHKHLKSDTKVRISNILNNKSLIGIVEKNTNYPSFNNVVLSKRIADELDLNIKQPYVEVLEIISNSIFIAQKAKTYDEEKYVAVKAPVNKISINDLNIVTKSTKKDSDIKFSYIIKIADFYFNDSALRMLRRIKNESSIKNTKIIKISTKKHRVFLGPFHNISSLQKSYNDISILQFENIEIIRND